MCLCILLLQSYRDMFYAIDNIHLTVMPACHFSYLVDVSVLFEIIACILSLVTTGYLYLFPRYFTLFFLTYWRVVDYHVDGFRFDLASVLCRGTDGSPLDAPPLIRVTLLCICLAVYTYRFNACRIFFKVMEVKRVCFMQLENRCNIYFSKLFLPFFLLFILWNRHCIGLGWP